VLREVGIDEIQLMTGGKINGQKDDKGSEERRLEEWGEKTVGDPVG
jgi:hypothetical protein